MTGAGARICGRIGLCVALLAWIGSGCGGEDGGANGEGEPSPRAEALSYIAADSPLALLVSTDPEGAQAEAARGLLTRLPGSERLVERAREQLTGALDFDRDVRPLLGNEAVIASETVEAVRSGAPPLIVIVAPDLDAATSYAIARGGEPAGDHRGAALLSVPAEQTAIAVDGRTLMIGGTLEEVKAMVDRHAGGDGFDEATIEDAFEGLPQERLAGLYLDLEQILAPARPASRPPFGVALRSLAVALTAESDRALASFRLDLGSAELEAADVPLAPDAPAPPRAGPGELLIGLSDPAHLARFVERALDEGGSRAAAGLTRTRDLLSRETGVDPFDLLAGFGGTITIASDLRTHWLRAELDDPAGTAEALARMASGLPGALSELGLQGTSIQPAGSNGFEIRAAEGTIGSFAVIEDALIAGNTGAAELRELSAGSEDEAGEGEGAFALELSAPALAGEVGERLGLAPELRDPLAHTGGARLTLDADTEALRGELAIEVPRR